MRKPLFSILFSLTIYASFSQQLQVKIDLYTVPVKQPSDEIVVVTMPFGKSNVIAVHGDTSLLKNAGDIMVDVVCTDYPAGASLKELNERRIEELYKVFPYIAPAQVQKIDYFRQMKGSEEQIARTLFHGLVIRFRQRQTIETMKQELSKLEVILEPVENKPVPQGAASSPQQSKKAITETVPDTLAIASAPGLKRARPSTPPKRKKVFYGFTTKIVPDIKKRDTIQFRYADSVSIVTPLIAYKEGMIDKNMYKDYKDSYLITLYFGPDRNARLSHHHSIDSLAVIKDPGSPSGYSPNPEYKLPDSTVVKVLGRTKWKNVTIVGDVTGSMYPYTAQLLVWLRLLSLDSFTTKFVFFNDGDNKRDRDKKIGSTGGIYSKKCHSFDEVKELVRSTMLKGGGGDCPENNIEALIHAERVFPGNDFHVLIADNWAPIKDKKLIKQLKKPVRVVLCGVNDGNLNTDYLNLARKTGGSVHLLEQDLYRLAAMHEGEELKIGRRTFRIVDGEFKEIFFVEGQGSL